MALLRAFRVAGDFRIAPTQWQKFRREVAAPDEAAAREHVFSDLGSKHGVARRYIRIGAITELKAEEVTSPVVRARLSGGGA